MPTGNIFPAPALTQVPCGLLSVADVWTPARDGNSDHWMRGFSQEFESRATVKLLSEYANTVTGGTLFDSTGLPRYIDVNSFIVEVSDFSSGIDNDFEFNLAKIARQLEAVSQKAVEKEFWDGLVARADIAASVGTHHQWLTRDTAPTAVIPRTGGLAASVALATLEQAIAGSPTGGNGVIHMTRDVASTLLGGSVSYKTGVDGRMHLETILGTPISVGSGYSGNGPIGNAGATASNTNKWMFATGAVVVHLGDIQSINTDNSMGFDYTKNDLTLKANRPAAVLFDPTIYAAAQVTLP